MQTLKLTKKYEHYPEYKDSGVEWVGEMPKGWGLVPMRSLSSENMERNFDGRCQNLLSLSYGKIIEKDIASNEGLLPESFNTYQIVKKGNIVFRLTDLQNDKRSLRVGYVDFDNPGIITSAYLAIKMIQSLDKKFAYYLFHSYDLQKVYYGMGGGVRQTLDFDNFKYLPMLLPNTQEQIKIANYLDEKTALIDQIIEKKKKLIELLREKRTAVINHAVMEQEGELGKLKNYITVNPSKKIVSKTNPEETVAFVPMEALSETGELTVQERKYKDAKDGFTYFENDDVVLAKITPCYENGKAGVMKNLKAGFGFGTTEFMVLRAEKKILPEYLYFLVFSDKFRKSGEVEMRGTAGQKRVTNSFVRNYEFKLPLINVQQMVVGELVRKSFLFDEALGVVEKTIVTLQEFKSSLISHVVTGKIKI